MTLDTTSPYIIEWQDRLSPLGFVFVAPRIPPPLGIRRGIFVRPAALEILQGNRLDTGFPDILVDRQMTVFSAGQAVWVSLLGDPSQKEPNLERLEGLDEAWAMCFRTPRPGWRLLGRLAAKNIFVGICLLDRRTLNGRQTYSEYARNAVTRWDNDLATVPPLRGDTLQHYLDGTVIDVDARDDF